MKRVFKIAGAGPSGLACALGLAKEGGEAVVLEKNRLVGERFAGSFQFLENFSHKEDALDFLKWAGVKKNFELTPQKRISVFGPSMREAELKSRKPLWYLVRRGGGKGLLDSSLLEQARDAGAKVEFGKKAAEKDVDVIAAGACRGDGVAKEIVFECEDEMSHILLDDRIAPKGYAYVFSHGGNATLCVAVMKDFRNIGAYCQKALERLQAKLGFKVKRPKEQTNFVSFYLPKRLSLEGRLLVGERAGFQDYLFGCGLRYAMESGKLAAMQMLGKGDYEEMAGKRIMPFMEAGVANRLAFELLGNRGYEALVKMAEGADAREFLQKWAAPSAFKSVMQQIIRKSVWRKKGRCGHGENCAWCRPV